MGNTSNKILFLQGPYSRFFRDLGKTLEGMGNHCEYITFNPGDSFLCRGMNRTSWRELLMDDKDPEGDFQLKDNYYSARVRFQEKRDLNEDEVRFFRSYYNGLRHYIREHGIDMIVMHNDTRWQHSYGIEAARAEGVPYYVFELGLFRPNTITMDSRGVNFTNSVPRDRAFFENPEIRSVVYSGEVESDISELKRNLLVGCYLLGHFWGRLFKLNAPDNKVLRLRDYMGRFRKTYMGRKKSSELNIPGEYIFVPFQVINDSQSLLYSPYEDMYEFAEDMIQGVKRYNAGHGAEMKVVFKEHPMDRGAVDYGALREKYKNNSGVIILEDGNIHELIKNSAAVVTVNSTAGLDGLRNGKRVACMGQAFYAVEGIAVQGEKGSVDAALDTLFAEPFNGTLVENFLSWLKNVYQVEGNEYYYNEKQLMSIGAKMVKRLSE